MKPSESTPDPDRWDRIEEICFGAMQLSGQERVAFVDAECAGDPGLRKEVVALLEASDRRPGFLERPVLAISGDPDFDEAGLGAEEEWVGPFRLVRPLGHGGMGDVYLAIHEGDGFSRAVAVKVIRRGFDTERVLERFRQERRILAGLKHPNIAGLIDGGATADGRPYFVMEYVEGVPIDEYCERQSLPVVARLELVRIVCAAVHHAHQNLVVHRDIKPGNILVTHDGVPKLVDFGIGKVLEEDGSTRAPATRVEERALTPEYAAPEQIDGGAVTTATDVYGIGVLLYRLITGRLPYPSETGSRLEARTLRERDPERPSTVRTEGAKLSREIDAIVLKALRTRPEERYSGPMALADDLERHLTGRPVLARGPSVGYVVRKFVARNRVAVASATLILAGILAGAGYTWRQSQRVAAERDKALEVRGFLLETFGAAGPDRATGNPVTARALLDGQAATVEEAYADDPALRAEMMTVLAEGYERLGLYAEAEGWARRVVDSGDAGRAEAAAARTVLGWVTHQQGRSREAEEILGDVVDRARSTPGAERTLARALNDLGVVQEALGDYDGASLSHEEARDLRAALFGPDHRSVAVSGSNLAAIHYRRGELDLAVREAERALEIIRRSFGPDHQRAIIVQSNLAVFKLVEGDLDGAEDDYRDLLERQARVQGAEHPVTVRVMISLATVLRRAGKWDEAEEVLREALRVESARDEANPVDVAGIMATLGDVLSADDRHDEGVAFIERAMELQVGALGSAHVDVAQSQSYLSHAWERVDSLALAVEWQRAVVTTLEQSLGSEHPQTVAEAGRLESLVGSLGGGGRGGD